MNCVYSFSISLLFASVNLLIRSIKRLFIAKHVSRVRGYLLTSEEHIPWAVIKIQVSLGIVCGENYRMPEKPSTRL